MKAVVVRRGETQPTVVEKPRPEPREGEALIRTLRVGIDGTDHEVLAGGHGGFPPGEEQMILGHEAVGVVEDPNDTAFDQGDLVVPTVRRPPPAGSNRYFDAGEPDMAPDGMYVECGIAGAHGFMADYFTSPEEFLIPLPTRFAEYGFLIEPLSNAEKALDLAAVSRSAFEWDPTRALVLGNGPLGLLTLALLWRDYESLYCLGRRDRPDPTIEIIECLEARYIDSRETSLSRIAEVHEPMDLVYEATGYAPHAFETIDALAPNGVGVLLGIPEDSAFEIDGGRFHRGFVLENKALVGSVNSSVPHFKAARDSLDEFPDWFIQDLITDVTTPGNIDAAFETGDDVIKSVVEFDTL